MAGIPDIKYAKNGSVSIAYQAFGEGPVLVGLPGVVSNIEVLWEEPMGRRYLTRLGEFSRFIHFDKRGQGLSDRDAGVPTMDDRLGDLAAVLDAEGVERAVLGGISEGGSTAALFAATYPERVSKLVLWSTAVCFSRKPDFPYPFEDEVYEAVFQDMAAKWGTPQTSSVPLFSPSMVGDETFLRWVNRYERQTCTPGGLLAAWAWIRDIDIRAVLPAIRCPTLVVRRNAEVGIAQQSLVAAELIPNARYVELEGVDHLPWVGDQDSVLDLVREFVTGASPAPPAPDRVLATVLFTDIVGSTERASALGDRGWRGVLERHDQIASEQIGDHGGRLVKSTGDGVLATFQGPGAALHCATRLRDCLASAGIPIRAGVHTGEIEVRGDDIGGIAVHIAARVEAKAGSGEVLATRTVKDLVAGSGVAFEPRGVHTLKGVPDDWQLYAVVGS